MSFLCGSRFKTNGICSLTWCNSLQHPYIAPPHCIVYADQIRPNLNEILLGKNEFWNYFFSREPFGKFWNYFCSKQPFGVFKSGIFCLCFLCVCVCDFSVKTHIPVCFTQSKLNRFITSQWTFIFPDSRMNQNTEIQRKDSEAFFSWNEPNDCNSFY